MEKEKAATDGTSDGAIIKPFLIDDGHCVVEFDATTDAHSNLIMFCIRGVGSRQGVFDGIKTAEDFLTKTLTGTRTKGIGDIVTVKNGNTFVERHDAVSKIVEILLESGATFDEANLALRLAREKVGCFEMKKRPSGN